MGMHGPMAAWTHHAVTHATRVCQDLAAGLMMRFVSWLAQMDKGFPQEAFF